MSIKYYRLAKDEEPPDKFCAVKDVGGEPSEYVFYVSEAENAKLRELVRDIMPIVCDGCYERLCEMPKEEHPFVTCSFDDRMRELGIEVDA